MYTRPEVRDLGAVQALTLSVVTAGGQVTKNTSTTADSVYGFTLSFGKLPTGTNCTINGGAFNGQNCTTFVVNSLG